jgi:EpsI family protein
MIQLSKRAILAGSAAIILAAQGAATYQIARNYRNYENPGRPALSLTPREVGEWHEDRELDIDPAALEMLSPDDYVSRVYRERTSGVLVDLFVTYYKSQLRDKNAHSPKVCLPGSGWRPVTSRTAIVPVHGGNLHVNYYVVTKGEAKNLVLYWYQTHRDAVADEYLLKVHRLWNSIRDNRTDMIFVRTICPIENGDEQAAFQRLMRFITDFRPSLNGQFDQRTAAGGA